MFCSRAFQASAFMAAACAYGGARLASRASYSLCRSLAFSASRARATPSVPELHSQTRRHAAPQRPLLPPSAPDLDSPDRRCFARGFSAGRATVAVGDRLPDATFSYFDEEGSLRTLTVGDLTKGKRAVLFAVPGAFTPTCSQQHLPGFVQKADEMKAKGVESIACVAVNDAFVLRAWGESVGVKDKVLLLCDVNSAFTKALGVTLDLSDKPAGLGVRSRRYSLLADDGVVKVLNLEEGGSFTTSGAEEILKAL